jgi:hypothetical protein
MWGADEVVDVTYNRLHVLLQRTPDADMFFFFFLSRSPARRSFVRSRVAHTQQTTSSNRDCWNWANLCVRGHEVRALRRFFFHGVNATDGHETKKLESKEVEGRMGEEEEEAKRKWEGNKMKCEYNRESVVVRQRKA